MTDYPRYCPKCGKQGKLKREGSGWRCRSCGYGFIPILKRPTTAASTFADVVVRRDK